MANEWYCLVNDNVLGPMSSDDFLAMATLGNLTPEDLVRKEIGGRCPVVDGDAKRGQSMAQK